MEIRNPLEDELVVVPPQRGEKHIVGVQPRMPLAPLVERWWPVRIGAARAQHAVLRLVPVLRRPVDPVRRELVDDEKRGECCEVRDPLVERIHVMEHASRDDGIPRSVDLLEGLSHVPLALGCLRVDAEDVVATRRERLDEPAFAAAPDLEDSTRRGRQLI